MNTQSHDPIMARFLGRQRAAILEMAGRTDLLRVMPTGEEPCDTYILQLRCRGLTIQGDQLQVHDVWSFWIRFPDDYLIRRVHVATMLRFLGPVPCFHCNMNHGYACLDIRPGTALTEIAYALADVVSWRSYSLSDPLNEAAAQWARRVKPGTLPVDHRPLIWKAANEETTDQTPDPALPQR